MIPELFFYPFMQRAFLVGVLLALILACLGVFVTLRKMAFFGEGIAHATLAGIAFAILSGTSPILVALIWSVGIAIVIYFLEHKSQLSSDTLIGILFTASMAIGVIAMTFTKGYQPELLSFLFGSILSVTWSDVLIVFIASVGIFVWMFFSYRNLIILSLSEERAEVAGIHVQHQTVLFYIMLAITTVLCVKILGIILVSALLILPSAISQLVANSFRSHFFMSLLFSEFMMLVGLILSFYGDLPSGATIVLVGTVLFFGMFVGKVVK